MSSLQYLPEPYTHEALNRLLVTDDSARGFYGLRSHVRRTGKVSGVAVAGMNREQCIGVLMGESDVAAVTAAVARPVVNGDATAKLAAAFAEAMASAQTPIDEAAAREIAHDEAVKAMNNGAFPVDRVKEIVSGMLAEIKPKRIEISVNGGPAREVKGHRHYQFRQVLTWLAASVPLWLWGGAGAGKTTLARQLGEALDVPAYVVSIDPTATMGKLLGFRNLVTGEFVEGLLYKPFKDGGLVLLDEIDTGDASILAGLNALLANDYYLFPNGETVAKNPKFYVMAGANTKGTGAVGWFSARVKLDGATLDRFACVELKYDRAMEYEIAVKEPAPVPSVEWTPDILTDEQAQGRCRSWVPWVQSVSEKVGNSLLVSPRASINGCKALRAGIPPAEVAEALVFKLAAEETKRAIIGNCGNPVEVLS